MRVALSAAALVLTAAAVAQTGNDLPWTARADVRNRFVSGIGGLDQVYRSVVNLDEGPRLFDGEARYFDRSGRYVDEINARGAAWGGDPYNTAHVDVRKQGLYELRFDYRNVFYFNNLPTFANPLLADGALLSQRALDVTRRQWEIQFDWKPDSRYSPYFAFQRAEGFGRGTTTFVSDNDEFPVDTRLDDDLKLYRGGVRINLRRWNFTLEQGFADFNDSQRIFFDGDSAPGNRRTPFLGRRLTLDRLRQSFDADSDVVFSRALAQGRPHETLSFSGQFVYSQPELDVRQDLDAAGEFFSLQAGIPFAELSEANLADANRPRWSGSWNTEYRPHARVRILQSWLTDRFHVASGSTLTQVLSGATESALTDVAVRSLVLDHSQHQVDGIFDVTRKFTVRGGHRYVWGDAETPAPSLDFGSGSGERRGRLRRHVALAGFHVRPNERLRISADFEGSPGDETFFRTGLNEYLQGKLRTRWRVREDLTLTGAFTILDNQNPVPGAEFDFQSKRTSVTLAWTRMEGRLTILADYTRSDIRSDVQALELPFFGTQLLSFRDRANLAGLFVEFSGPRDLRFKAGGSAVRNGGSRPTSFYQPQVSLDFPLARGFRWVGEWKWYGFDERFLRVENFRAHTVSVGLIGSF